MKTLFQFFFFILFATHISFAQTYTVNTNNDVDDGVCNSSHCSLREAINAANSNIGTSAIHFNIAGTGPHTIQATSSFPHLNGNDITIDGTTQSGNYPMNGQIILDGSLIAGTSLSPCFSIYGDNISVFGLEIINFGLGLRLGQTGPISNNITIGEFQKGNHIHQMAGGCSFCWDGILANNINNISIAYNVFGATWNGTAPSGEMFYGITLYDGTGMSIHNNLFSVNYTANSSERAMFIGDVSGTVSNNYIGINPSLTNNLAQGDGIGIYISADAGAPGFSILNNYFSNLQTAINVDNSNHIIQQNTIFNNTNGIIVNANDVNNLLTRNYMYCNDNGGISLSTGANNNMAPPIITFIDETSISGTAAPNAQVEIYGDFSGCSPCQGGSYETLTYADASGNWSTSIFSCGQAYTALAVDISNNTSEFAACTVSADECLGAIELTLETDICQQSYGGCYINSSPSPEFIYDCTGALVGNSGNDFWYKTTVPSTGAIMLQVDLSFLSDLPVVETYRGSCTSLSLVQCDTIYAFPHALTIANETPGDQLFFRFFDLVNPAPGQMPVTAYEMDANPANWILCPEGETTGQSATEFLVQYEIDATPADILAATNNLIANGAILVDECNCSPAPLQLWQASNPIEMEEKRKTARATSKVDTVNYNFVVYQDYCNILYNTDTNGPSFTVLDTVALFCGEGEGQIYPYPSAPYMPVSPQYGVKVAVIDTGVDKDHPWIQQAIWNNPESNDSDNCVLGDTYGYDFFNRVGDPVDIDGHGTSVNSVICNDFPSDVDLDIVNLKFFEGNVGKLFDAVCSMHYAISEDVDVMNLSWGFFHPEVPSILGDALERAYTKDILVVNSAGNSSLDNDLLSKLPSNNNYKNFITVAAVHKTPLVEIADYSNFGVTNVDLGALGYIDVARPSNGRDTLYGTSLAAPLVARTAAVIRAYYPMLSASEVRNCILSTVEVHPSLQFYVATSGILDHDAAVLCAYNTALAKCNNSDVTITNTLAIDTTVLTDTRIFSDALLPNGIDVEYRAGICIELQSGFEVELGAEFLGIIEGCSGTIPVPLGVYDAQK